jgi:glutamine amidotransferase
LIGVINYGLGNIQSFLNSYRLLGVKAIQVKNTLELNKCDHLILPGVGSFDAAMIRLKSSKLLDSIEKLVFKEKIPILGVCVGLQIMARKSEEGDKKGLGWLDGEVKLIKKTKDLPLPHMGWNTLQIHNYKSQLLKDTDNKNFYFLHSYCMEMDTNEVIMATADYGKIIVAAVSKNNIHGCQFHPEKSHTSGLIILENFAKL